MKKMLGVVLALASGICLFAADPLAAGLDAYAHSDWSTAILSFRKATTVSGSGAEPWYWLVMSELSQESYDTALADMDRFTATFPADARVADITYQKGRVQYIKGRYEDSIATLYSFIKAWPNHQMIPSAYYWVGESLFSVGRFDEAERIFSLVVTKYPDSVKREASVYRLALMKQTDKQEELLKLLKMSHEESLKIIEDYQRREKTYEQAITAYQKRISEMIKDTRLGELEKQLGDEKVKNSTLLDRISQLEVQNAELAASLAMTGAKVPESVADGAAAGLNSSDPETRRKALDALKEKARALQQMYDKIDSTGGSTK
jgi:Uncharacterized protein conserved in bacteria